MPYNGVNTVIKVLKYNTESNAFIFVFLIYIIVRYGNVCIFPGMNVYLTV